MSLTLEGEIVVASEWMALVAEFQQQIGEGPFDIRRVEEKPNYLKWQKLVDEEAGELVSALE